MIFCFFWITLAPSESTCSTFFMNHSRALFLELHLENAFQGANVKNSENKLFFIEFGQITHNQNIH